MCETKQRGLRHIAQELGDRTASGLTSVLFALGRVKRDAADEELAGAIDAVLANASMPTARAARLAMREPEDDLTEREVLRQIALGDTNQEIAGQHFVSVRTIKAHHCHVLDKLRPTMRAQLVRCALEHGIVQVGAA